MKRLLLLILLTCISSLAKSQMFRDIGSSLKKKPQFFFNFTQYNSFINRESANISGIRAGLEFDKKVRLAVGYGWLYSEIVDLIEVSSPEPFSTNGELKFRYVNTMFEYEFYKKYPWQISVPFQFGAGGAHYEYIDLITREKKTTKNFPLVLAEPSITAQYSIIDWVGVAAGLGYRFTMNSTEKLKKDFNSPIYIVKLRIFFDVIYEDLFSKKPE